MKNVVRDYDWCSLPRGSTMRNKAPKVWVRSYKLKSNAIMTAINGYVAIATGGGDGNSFYKKMYSDSTTEDETYCFPFFGDDVRSFANNFGDTFQDGVGNPGGGIGNTLNEIIKGATGKIAEGVSIAKNVMGQNSPGAYVETPMFYQYEKNDSPLNVSFILANTINSDSVQKNYDLITELTKINRPLRKNSIEIEPPRIFKVKVPGHRYIEWAYCSSFSVSLLGTKREINGIITPEAYQVNMTFQSLTLEHAGFMDKTK